MYCDYRDVLCKEFADMKRRANKKGVLDTARKYNNDSEGSAEPAYANYSDILDAYNEYKTCCAW